MVKTNALKRCEASIFYFYFQRLTAAQDRHGQVLRRLGHAVMRESQVVGHFVCLVLVLVLVLVFQE